MIKDPITRIIIPSEPICRWHACVLSAWLRRGIAPRHSIERIPGVAAGPCYQVVVEHRPDWHPGKAARIYWRYSRIINAYLKEE